MPFPKKMYKTDPSFTSRHWTPYTRLWASVLDRAIRDYYSYTRGDSIFYHPGEQQAAKREVEHWFRVTDNEPGSFYWVCDMLNIEPDSVIHALDCPIKQAKYTRYLFGRGGRLPVNNSI